MAWYTTKSASDTVLSADWNAQALNIIGVWTTAAAATTDLGAQSGMYGTVTGTASITSFGNAPVIGTRKIVKFDAGSTITHNGTSLILPSGQNIVTVSGDIFEFVALSTGGNWICTTYSAGVVAKEVTTGFTVEGGATAKTLTVDSTVSTSALAPLASPTFSGTCTIPTGVPLITISDYIELNPMGCMIPTTAPASVDQAESGAGAANYVYGLYTYAGIGAVGIGNNLQWKVTLPEDWLTTGVVSAKIHWLPKAGTENHYVKWEIEAKQLAEGDAISSAFVSLGTCEDQLLATPANKIHISPACTPAAISGTAGSEIIFRVTRIAAQATASSQDIRLLGVSVKYIRTLA